MKQSKATDAQRVATDIAAIKAALHERGYRLRKQPKQPVWKVLTPHRFPSAKRGTGRFYLLTYQPAPISAWVLHPQDNNTHCHTIETIIQHALGKQPTNLTRRAS